jgi:prephenate dehydrogenase
LVRLEQVDHIVAFDTHKESLLLAKEEGVIDEYSEQIDQSFSDCDIVFISTPVKLIP